MDKGVSVQNPYAGVTIPRAQLKSSFIRDTLGEDLDGVVITNQSTVPTYPMYITQEVAGNSNPNLNSSEGYRIHTQESWRRPYNPYASDKPQNGQSDAMYNIDLDKQYKEVTPEEKPCCCCPCCNCSPCCRKCCCVIS